MKADSSKDSKLVKFAIGFERYAFGQQFVLESESWKEAEEKINKSQTVRKAHGAEVNRYYEGGGTLWREYQFLFLCQLAEFKLAELIGRLHGAGKLKKEYVAQLQRNSRADPERAREIRRITSPASLLEDLVLSLSQLVKIIENETLPFEQIASLLAELHAFKKDRNKFIHHSFGGKENVGNDIADALQSGKLLLKRLESLMTDGSLE